MIKKKLSGYFAIAREHDVVCDISVGTFLVLYMTPVILRKVGVRG